MGMLYTPGNNSWVNGEEKISFAISVSLWALKKLTFSSSEVADLDSS
jgi:hypothetical protein